MVKIPAALVAALSIMNSSGAIPGATCSGASHSSGPSQSHRLGLTKFPQAQASYRHKEGFTE